MISCVSIFCLQRNIHPRRTAEGGLLQSFSATVSHRLHSGRCGTVLYMPVLCPLISTTGGLGTPPGAGHVDTRAQHSAAPCGALSIEQSIGPRWARTYCHGAVESPVHGFPVSCLACTCLSRVKTTLVCLMLLLAGCRPPSGAEIIIKKRRESPLRRQADKRDGHVKAGEGSRTAAGLIQIAVQTCRCPWHLKPQNPAVIP